MPSDTESKIPAPKPLLLDSDVAMNEMATRQERQAEAQRPVVQREAAPTGAQRMADLRSAVFQRLRAGLAKLQDSPATAPAPAGSAVVTTLCGELTACGTPSTEAISERPLPATPDLESDQLVASTEPEAFVWGTPDLVGFADEAATTATDGTRKGVAVDCPLISVVLVTYQQERFIRAAVRSLLAQTYAPLDIIILDDASPDATAAVAAAALASNPGEQLIRFIRNPRNLGFFGNVRKGVSLARGDFVIVFCGDDVMLPNMVEKMVETWRRHDVSLVTANVAYIDADGADLQRFHTDPTGPYDDTFETLARDGANSVCFGAAMGFERDLYLEFGYPPDYLTAEDIMLPFYAYLAKGARYIPEPLMQYRVHANNDSLDLKRERSSAIDKLLVELEMYSVHLVHSVEMANELERRREAEPARFDVVASRILPLLSVQRAEMAAKLAATRVKLAKFGLTRLLVPGPVPESGQMLSEAAQ